MAGARAAEREGAAACRSLYKRIRRLQFAELLKTTSGKIRRVELRDAEAAHLGAAVGTAERRPLEFREEDLPELRR